MPENEGPPQRSELEEARQALAMRWGVQTRGGAAGDESDYELLLEVLTERVAHLLAHRHQKLMASLYILDISERRYNEAMKGVTHLERAARLARAILERETEKIHSRRKYAARPQDELGD